MNSLFVWFIRLLSPLWARFGADPRAVTLIVAAKLRVSDRSTHLKASGMKQKGSKSWASILIYVFYFFIGIFSLVLLVSIPHFPTAAALMYTITGLYLAMLLILEFSESIFDTRDVMVLLTRPISDATFSLSRGLFVFTYAAKISLAMFTVPFILLTLTRPWQLPVFLLAATAVTALTTIFVLLLYQLLLRTLSTDAFKRFLGLIQMVFSGFFIAIYLAPQAANGLEGQLENFRIVDAPVGFAFPTFFLGAWHALPSASWLVWFQAGLGIALLVAALLAYRAMAAGFGQNILALQQSGSAAEGEVGTPAIEAKDRDWNIGQRLARLVTRAGVERASFRFHWAMMVRSRSFKTKVYPTLIFAPVFVVFFILRDAMSADDILGDSPGMLLLGLYYLSLTVVTPLANLRQSEVPEAAWVWTVAPLGGRGPVAYGQYLAALCQFFLPTVLVVVPMFLYLAGPGFIPDVALALGVSVIIGVVYQSLQATLPLSVSRTDGQYSGFLAMIAAFLLAGTAALVHYGLRWLGWGVPLMALAVWIIAVLSLWGLRNISAGYD